MNKSTLTCPNCGSHHLSFLIATSANFEISKNCRPGNVETDEFGLFTISMCREEDGTGDVEFHCRDCNSTFEADYDSNEDRYYIGNEI